MFMIFLFMCILSVICGENEPMFPLKRVIFPPEPLNEPTVSASEKREEVTRGTTELSVRATTLLSKSLAKPIFTTSNAPRRTCALFISSDGVMYRNRCVTKDGAAQCTMAIDQLVCKCSSDWTGPYCHNRKDGPTAAKNRRTLWSISSTSLSVSSNTPSSFSSPSTSPSPSFVISILLTTGLYVSLL